MKMKLRTGKPPRRQRTAPVKIDPPVKINPATLVTDKPKKPRVRKPVVKINPASLAPLDTSQRYSLRETAAYLRTSLPSVHKLINEKALEAIKEGARTYVSGRSIAARSLPPSDRPPSTNKKPSAPYERLSDPPQSWPKSPTRHVATKARARARAGQGVVS
jgi:hypothetical protein